LLMLPLSIQRHLLRRVTAQLCDGQSPLELRHYVLIEQLLQREGVGDEEQQERGYEYGEIDKGIIKAADLRGDTALPFPLGAINRAPTLDLPGQLRVMCDFNMIVFARLTDRKSTRLNSSHVSISYAVFCLKKKKSDELCVRNQ